MDKSISAEKLTSLFRDGMSIMVGGFLANGTPEKIIDLLLESGVKDLTLIANDTSYPDRGCGRLVAEGRVKKLIVSHIGTNPITGQLYNEGKIEIEFCPQGTLAERVRAGGAGLGGVLTATGMGTVVAEGKQVIEVDGKEYLLEKPIRADFAFIRGSEGDAMGNLVYKGTTQNFQPMMAMAADTVVAEIGKMKEVGSIETDQIHTSGIFVDYIFG